MTKLQVIALVAAILSLGVGGKALAVAAVLLLAVDLLPDRAASPEDSR